MTDRYTTMTDHRGTVLVPEDQRFEPEPGSIVLTEGLHGTAWQRHFSDGLWHSTRGGRPQTWAFLMSKRNLVLVYDADVRPHVSTGPVTYADAAMRKEGA